jgi:hypothetical protein
MYSLSQLRRGLESPKLVLQEANRLYHRRLTQTAYNAEGYDLFEADWDNLLILDACRYDMFRSVNDLPGRLESRQSRGSATSEFLRANFDGRVQRETVYVTASPMLRRNEDRINVELQEEVDVWRQNGWDERYKTVLPETMVEYALQAADRFPSKRLLVHFMQPHFPFLGPTGREHFDGDRLDFRWRDVMTGDLDVDVDLLWQASVENLERVLPHVETLLRSLDGKTVVTSDHGQAFGERSRPIPYHEYGHPPGLYTDELVTVPWHVYVNGDRRRIVGGETSAHTSVDDGLVKERLRDLGYHEAMPGP